MLINKKIVRRLLKEVHNEINMIENVKNMQGGKKIIDYAIHHIRPEIIGTSDFDKLFEHVRYELSLISGIRDLINEAGLNDLNNFTHVLLDKIIEMEL